MEPIDEDLLDRIVLLLVHFPQTLPGIVEVVASNRKIPGVTLDLGIDALHRFAHQVPEVRRTRANLAFEKRENFRPQFYNGHRPDALVRF